MCNVARALLPPWKCCEKDKPKIAPPRIKFEEIVEEGGEDRISALEDCLLVEILSRLPATRVAIRTGTLSKRWKHLWTSVDTLIFIHSDVPLSRFLQNPNSRSDFVSFVDKTLTQCRQLKLKKFEVLTTYRHTGYHIPFKLDFNKWMHYAISCNVEELTLEFWQTRSEDKFQLNQIFFINSCFTNLRLAGCTFNPTVAIHWKNLRSLSIFKEKLDEDLIENILSGSPVLETLELGDCYGYKRLDITSKSIKNLVFTDYFKPNDDANIPIHDDDDNDDDFNTRVIEINAPNILSLTIKRQLWLSKLLFVNVSSLLEANLDYQKIGRVDSTPKEAEEDMLKGFILKLHHVKELKIGPSCFKVVSRLEAKGFVFPSNIKIPDAYYDWSDSDSDERED